MHLGGRDVIRLEFATAALRRECGDHARLVRRWGSDTARKICHRLQQLEAMTTLGDLEFMPFDHRLLDDNTFELAVLDGVVLRIATDSPSTSTQGAAMQAVVILDICVPSDRARRS